MSFSALLGSETPPRMWRKPSSTHKRAFLFGSTSTYVEKTAFWYAKAMIFWKHLHVCGENFILLLGSIADPETPPRMWRKLVFTEDPKIVDGNTSTYVEKTHSRIWRLSVTQKHLHVCGENLNSPRAMLFGLETPPRMWRKLAW